MIIAKSKHLLKLVADREYRELMRIKNTPRYTTLVTDLLESRLQIVDGLSFYYSYLEIFKNNIYKFLSSNQKPVIIDAGSNIGLSVIYFKKTYPESQIYAFEASPNVFETLKSNVKSFKLNDVHLINKAIWNSETTLSFIATNDDSGRISRTQDISSKNKVKVETTRLTPYLNKHVDFLKLDIEGAETTVIKDCADYLGNVDNIFVEYHSFLSEKQTLDELLSILKKNNFRVQIQTQFYSPQPFLSRTSQYGMDLQLNIFGYRE